MDLTKSGQYCTALQMIFIFSLYGLASYLTRNMHYIIFRSRDWFYFILFCSKSILKARENLGFFCSFSLNIVGKVAGQTSAIKLLESRNTAIGLLNTKGIGNLLVSKALMLEGWIVPRGWLGFKDASMDPVFPRIHGNKTSVSILICKHHRLLECNSKETCRNTLTRHVSHQPHSKILTKKTLPS